MPYIFSAQEAGMLAAGLADDGHNRETQRLLTLVECAVRSACLKKKQSVELLAPDFRGWDKNNIATLSPCAVEVLDALSKAGYHFYTCHLVKLGSEYGEAVEIPYTHTVITWPQFTAVDTTKFNVTVLKMPSQEGYTSIGEAFVDSLPVQEKPPFRQELPGDFYVKHDSSTVVEVGADEEADLGADEAYFREPTPKPANPSQLLSNWNEGPKLPTLDQPTPPDSGPVQLELCGTEKGELTEIGTINALLSLLGEQQVNLKLGLRMQPPGFWARRNWGSPGEVALFQVALNGVYDAAMIGENYFYTEFDLDVRAGELVKCFQEVGFLVALSIEKTDGKPRQRLTLGWGIL